MVQAQVPGCSYPLAIGEHEEAERAAALLETASLERAELEHPRDREGGRANHPGMGVEPEPVMHERVDLSIPQKRHERERRPDDGIARQERSWYRIWASLLPTSMHDHRDHRHTRRQHHPHHHDLPACQEHDQGHQHREMALLKQVVMIDQVALVGESREKGDRPGSHYENIGPENRCTTAYSCTVLHIGDV